jgi:glycosyltransferase involved in cell wall biosynthesis
MPYLRDSLESLLGQDYADFDIHILDDCSTDDSLQYLESVSSPRIRLHRNSVNRGLFYNLNFLTEASDSRLVKLWSQDDVMAGNALSAIAAFHDENPEIGMSYTAVQLIDAHGDFIENGKIDTTPPIIDRELHDRIAFRWGSIAGNIANVTLDRRIFSDVGPFNEQMRIAADTEMWFRIAGSYRIGFLNQKVIYLRNHSGQFSRQEKYYLNHLREELSAYRILIDRSSPAILKDGLRDMRRYKLQFYMTLMLKAFSKGKFRTGFRFFRELAAFDNIFILSWNFLLYRILKLK